MFTIRSRNCPIRGLRSDRSPLGITHTLKWARPQDSWDLCVSKSWLDCKDSIILGIFSLWCARVPLRRQNVLARKLGNDFLSATPNRPSLLWLLHGFISSGKLTASREIAVSRILDTNVKEWTGRQGANWSILMSVSSPKFHAEHDSIICNLATYQDIRRGPPKNFSIHILGDLNAEVEK